MGQHLHSSRYVSVKHLLQLARCKAIHISMAGVSHMLKRPKGRDRYNMLYASGLYQGSLHNSVQKGSKGKL